MHIDHSKLVELLSEASGIEQKKVEKQLKELVDEVQQAISDGDAYEVEGFGIFSGIGNNLIFIPSEELSTEINYKYVGMEPISVDNQDEDEMEEDVVSDTDPEPAVPKIEENDSELEDDPFAGLLDDEPESEPEPDEEETDPDDEPAIEEENPMTEDSPEKEKPSYDDVFDDLIFGDEEASEEQIQAGEEERVHPGPEKWGIDSYRDDNDENMFTGLLGNKEEEPESAGQQPEIENEEKADEPKLSIQLDEESVPDTGDFDENDEDFDDPFKGLNEDEDEMEGEAVEEDDEEIVPVITNISSGTGEKEESANAGLKPKTRSSMERKNSPILLWILLSLIILGGGAYALGYFGIVTIPGIEAQYAGNQNTSMNIGTPEATEENNVQENTEAMETPVQPPETDMEENNSAPVQEEQAASEQDPINDVSEDIQETAANQPTYGLMGAPEAGANNGYTIVIYSLSQEVNAENQRQQLLKEGYRALVYPLPHAQYGTIYRVSIGQFESLRDAALAAENLSQPFSENYFITKIQPTN